MSVASNAPPATVSKALDAVADAVLAMANSSPRPTRYELAKSVQLRFGIEVSPDNLRMWIARRQADAVRASITPAVVCPLDDHLELVNELRDPSLNGGRVYIWTLVLAQLKAIDPTLESYTAGGLRSWYSRRVRRVAKVKVTAAQAIAGRNAAGIAGVDLPITPPAVFVTAAPISAPAVTLDRIADDAPITIPHQVAGHDAKRDEANNELKLLRNGGDSELGNMLGRFLPSRTGSQ